MECEKGKGVKDGIKALGTRETRKVIPTVNYGRERVVSE